MRNSRLSGAQVIAALADVLATHHAGLEPEAPPDWGPPHRALDAALAVDLHADAVQIERARYRREVVGPVEAFRRRHPEVRSLADLSARIAAHPTPEDFAREDLMADERRGPVARAVVDFLLACLDASADAPIGATDAERLAEAMGRGWTHYSDHPDIASASVGAHGLAYLQMRLGAPVVVPEGPVLALLDEVCGGEGDEESVAAAVRRAELPPLRVLQALRTDWARGRGWSAGSPTEGQAEAWPRFLTALSAALDVGEEPGWDAVVQLLRMAPHVRPGLAADAARGDTLATLRALGRQGRVPSYAAVADQSLQALALGAAGHAMDAETGFATAHDALHALIGALEALGEPIAPDVLGPLRALVDRTAHRIPVWARRVR